MLSILLTVVASLPPLFLLSVFLGVSIKDMLQDGKVEWHELLFSCTILLCIFCVIVLAVL